MKPSLLVLAAGIGSRYGSMKQVDQFGPSGETIIDYSIFDALRAGFGQIVFVIGSNFEEEFNRSFRKRYPKEVEIDYVVQDVTNIPRGYKVPTDRTKPWGTGHAVLVAKPLLSGPFAVVNGDDYYGPESYREVFRFLLTLSEREFNQFCLAGYQLDRTLSEHGFVSRGVCQLDINDYLLGIQERTKIGYYDNKIQWADEYNINHTLDPSRIVSMNMFGFTPSIFNYLEEYFEKFIRDNFENPKAEFFLPSVVNKIVDGGYGKVKVLRSKASWFGVTYKEDKPIVIERIAKLIEEGVYPSSLWK